MGFGKLLRKGKKSNENLEETTDKDDVDLPVDMEKLKAARKSIGGDTFLPDYVLTRLFTCHSDEKKAVEAVKLYSSLRHEYMDSTGIKGNVVTLEDKEVEREERKKKLVLSSHKGKNGEPVHVCFFEIKRHFKAGDTALSDKICHLIYYFEEAVKRLERKGGILVLALDAGGIGLKNADLSILQHLSTLQKVYRDLISKIFVVNANMIFTTSWNVAKHWFSPRIVAKIEFIKGDKLKTKFGAEYMETTDDIPERVQALWDKAAADKFKAELKELNKRVKDDHKELKDDLKKRKSSLKEIERVASTSRI